MICAKWLLGAGPAGGRRRPSGVLSATTQAGRPGGSSVLGASAPCSARPGPGGSDGRYPPPRHDMKNLIFAVGDLGVPPEIPSVGRNRLVPSLFAGESRSYGHHPR